MDIAPDDEQFLKALVKTARQRIHQIKWVDRDGTPRLTLLCQAEIGQVNNLARKLKLSPAELMRQAAHIPVSKPAEEKPIEIFKPTKSAPAAGPSE